MARGDAMIAPAAMDTLELYRWAVQDPEPHAIALPTMYERNVARPGCSGCARLRSGSSVPTFGASGLQKYLKPTSSPS
jgi:hypothetical protein